MTDYFLPSFLTDLREYQQAEALWRESWDALVRCLGQERSWESPWLNTDFADGTPCRDGNPIFSAVSPDRRLGVQVIQLGPSDDANELYAWIDTFAEGSPESIKTLVISCVLTRDSLNEAVELMRQWITEEKIRQPPDSHDGPCPANTYETLPAPALSDRPPPSSA